LPIKSIEELQKPHQEKRESLRWNLINPSAKKDLLKIKHTREVIALKGCQYKNHFPIQKFGLEDPAFI
jgi:hypothetical protein